MSTVIVENLSKFYPGSKGKTFYAVERSNLTIKSGEFMVLVGPSGCGKSTTLRMVAGLEEISEGTISIDGRIVNDVPPKDRDIAMVFQNYALYPHMSVFKNMAFGLELRKMPKADIAKRVREAAQILGLTDEMLQRKPKDLSGGQRQRVALGRAIVRQPKVFLFDEPLSNLDAKMRVQTRIEISKLHRQLGATMIYVTHDQVEAMTMGDRICLMKDGRILQVAAPLELYDQPANMFVAAFIGSPPMNFFTGTILSDAGALYFSTAAQNSGNTDFSLKIDALHQSVLEARIGQKIILGLRPENLNVHPSGTKELNTFSATIEAAEGMGAETHLHLTAATTPFIIRMPGHAAAKAREKLAVHARMDTARYFEYADRSPFINEGGQVDTEKWQVACQRIR